MVPLDTALFNLAGILNSIVIVTISLPLKRSGIITCTALISLLNIVQFVLTNNYASCVMVAITLLYSLCSVNDEKYPVLRSHGVVSGVVFLYLAAYVFTASSVVSSELFILFGSITGMVAVLLVNQIRVKIVQIAGNLSFGAFSVLIGAYGQLPGQVASLVLLFGSLGFLVWKEIDILPKSRQLGALMRSPTG